MRFYGHEKLALIVDGPSLHLASQTINLDLDYALLRDFFGRQATLVNCSYFSRMQETEEFNPVRRLVDYLEFNGWSVFTSDRDAMVDMAVFAMEMAYGIDHFVLATGDQRFCTLAVALQRLGKQVTVLSTTKAGTALCSSLLRRDATQFIELEELRQIVARTARAKKDAVAS